MIRSMTGYGRGEAAEGALRYEVEVRSVNHRFLEIRLRIPQEISPLESEMRARVGKSVRRGRIDLSATRTPSKEPEGSVAINREVIARYLEAATALAADFRLPGTLTLESVLALPGAVRIEYRREANPSVQERPLLLAALDGALAAYEQTRAAEGERLAEDLAGRLRSVEADLGEIERLAASTTDEYSTKLRKRIRALLEEVPLDEGRLMQEAAYQATRTDVTEEVVRLQAHLQQMRDTLSAVDGPVGKSLDFLVQEMHREANTIGSKVENLAISQAVLRVKAEVEKVREQVQNIE